MANEATAVEVADEGAAQVDFAAAGRVFDTILTITPDDVPLVRQLILAARFWQRVEKTDDHWLWLGSIQAKSGMPIFGIGSGNIGAANYTTAARFAWRCFHGEAPRGHHIVRRCYEPRCVRPEPGHHEIRHGFFRSDERSPATDREVAMRVLYADQGLTLQQIGDLFGITRERVRQILAQGEGAE